MRIRVTETVCLCRIELISRLASSTGICSFGPGVATHLDPRERRETQNPNVSITNTISYRRAAVEIADNNVSGEFPWYDGLTNIL